MWAMISEFPQGCMCAKVRGFAYLASFFEFIE